MKRWWIGWLMLGCFVSAEAQIRIIPHEFRDSVANPATVEQAAIRLPRLLEMGRIPEEGGVWSYRITWQNGEKSPVVITGIQSSCGCLKAEFDPQPVKQGGEGWLTISYNPQGRPGAVDQRLFLYTNLSASVPTAIIRLTGHVTPAADKRGRYPHALGTLLLRQTTCWSDGAREVRIACLNGGTSPLEIGADAMLSPRGVKIATEPAILPPGREGDLVIRIEGEFATGSRLPLCLEGLEVPPRRRMVVLGIGPRPETEEEPTQSLFLPEPMSLRKQ